MKVAFNIQKKTPSRAVQGGVSSNSREVLTTFDGSLAGDEGPKVIPLSTQRAPKSVTFLPKRPDEDEIDDHIEAKPVQYGLVLPSSAPITGQTPVEAVPEPEQEPEPEPEKPKTLEEQALSELLAEGRGESGVDEETRKTVPLLMQSRIDGVDGVDDEDEKFKIDVDSRPDECTIDEYESMPVESFGEAVLRGMGWDKGKSIGLNSSGLVKPIEFIKRPGTHLGLGAEPPKEMMQHGKKRTRKPGEKEDEGPMALPIGPDGKVRHTRTLDEKLVPIHSEEYQRSKRRAQERYEREQARKRGEAKQAEKPRNAPPSKGHASKAKSRERREEVQWINPELLVRVVSRSFAGGRYYKEKGTIVDVPGRNLAVLRFPNGKTVEAAQRYLETVIPRVGGVVLVVGPPGNPRLRSPAIILSRNLDKNRAQVQFTDDLAVETFSLDHLCQFMGRPDEF